MLRLARDEYRWGWLRRIGRWHPKGAQPCRISHSIFFRPTRPQQPRPVQRRAIRPPLTAARAGRQSGRFRPARCGRSRAPRTGDRGDRTRVCCLAPRRARTRIVDPHAVCDFAQAAAGLALGRRAMALHRAGDDRRRFRHLRAGGIAGGGPPRVSAQLGTQALASLRGAWRRTCLPVCRVWRSPHGPDRADHCFVVDGFLDLGAMSSAHGSSSALWIGCLAGYF